MEKQDFLLSPLNQHMSRVLQSQSNNFCRFIALGLEKKVSVTGLFSPPASEKKEYVTLGPSLEPVKAPPEETVYYGVSPLFDSPFVIRAISSLSFPDAEGLDGFIAAHGRLFAVHRDQQEHLLDLARYIVVSVACLFGVRIRMEPSLAKPILEDERVNHPSLVQYQDGVLTIFGCPTRELMEQLSRYQYVSQEDEKNAKWRAEAGKHGKTIREVYASSGSVSLVRGKVFYSGVLLRPVSLEVLGDNLANQDVTPIRIGFERSTYASTFALDHNYTEHPVLKKSKAGIVSMLRFDDECKLRLNEHLRQMRHGSANDEYTRQIVSLVNEYLAKCYNINQITVSSNLITSDHMVLLGKRSTGSIDAGCLYPSVNGTAELADRQVSHYVNSVHEDFPSIHPDDDRIDFLDEINREAYAELKILLPKQEWRCIGLALIGNIPNKANAAPDVYPHSQRRMQINILFENECSQSFMEIEQNWKTATERFENQSFMGLSVFCHKNVLSLCLQKLASLLNWITDNNDVLESLMLILLFFSAMLGKDSMENNDWYSVATLVLACLIVLSTIRNAGGKIKRLKRIFQTLRVRFFRSTPREKRWELLDQALKKYSFAPFTYALLLSHVERVAYGCVSEEAKGNQGSVFHRFLKSVGRFFSNVK